MLPILLLYACFGVEKRIIDCVFTSNMERQDHMVRVHENEYEILQQLKDEHGFFSLGEVLESIMDSFIGYSDDDED